MIIRNMIIEDLPELALLYKQFWGKESDLKSMKELFKILSDRDSHIMLSAIDDNKLVGSVTGIICDELYGQCKPFMVLENMIVDIRYRNKGIGKALIEDLERIALERQCTQIILVTEVNRNDACSFYEQIGYSRDTHRGYKKKLSK